MQYTDNEAALIGGLISNYFFQPSVEAKLRESFRRVLHHLHENTLSASDLSRIQNALTFLSPLCLEGREAHKEMMGFLGAGNNPMVGMTVAVAVAVEQALK